MRKKTVLHDILI